jgi:osmotically-inducible protein OsmY
MDSGDRILKQVWAALERDQRVNLHTHPLRISLDAEGALILEGELANIAAKKLALEHAATIPGVSGIVDRLRVSPSRPMSDAEIREHVCDSLFEEPTLTGCALRTADGDRWQNLRQSTAAPPCSIDVRVDEGVVTLNGQVSSLSQKRLAGALAWWVPGTRDLVNGLEVLPLQEDSDDECTEAVKLVLEKDPLINADGIHVRTRNSVVTLEGLVANETESEMTEMDAWYVFGVDRVVNRLKCER